MPTAEFNSIEYGSWQVVGDVADPDEIEVVPEERTTAMGPRGGYGVHDRVDMLGH